MRVLLSNIFLCHRFLYICYVYLLSKFFSLSLSITKHSLSVRLFWTSIAFYCIIFFLLFFFVHFNSSLIQMMLPGIDPKNSFTTHIWQHCLWLRITLKVTNFDTFNVFLFVFVFVFSSTDRKRWMNKLTQRCSKKRKQKQNTKIKTNQKDENTKRFLCWK